MRNLKPQWTENKKAKSCRLALAHRRGERSSEQGYILLAVLFLVVMVLISLSIAVPKIAADIERDREMELIHRGKQYIRAIKLYYKKFGAYPPNLDALEKTNEIRFLRKRYKDPITGKDEWHLIHFGENKTPSYGFFGQPIGGTGGSTIAGIGPGGVGSSLTASTFGSSSSSGSSFGSSSFGSSSFGSNSNSGTTTNGSATGSSGTDSSSGSSSGTSSGSGSGSSSSTDSTSGSSSSSSSGFGSNGQTFGGGGIIGVESTSPKLAILMWKKKTHFNEWEFWYDPNADKITISSSSLGTAANTTTSSPSLFNQAPGTSSTTTTGTTTTGTTTTSPQ